jgi:hypothetical protein
MSTTLKLPPTERDFEIYEAVHVAGCSTYSQALKHQISQTRVRQIVCRVVEWLSEVLPPQAKVAKEQETHLARQIAADRFLHQLEEATTFWDQTRELKYAGLRIRLTTAQARLGVVGGRLDGLAADAIEGIPVPTWQAEAPAEPNPKSKIENPQSWAPAHAGRKPRRTPVEQLPPELLDPLDFDEITPEIVAARAAHGYPIHPDWIRRLQEAGRLPLSAGLESSSHKGTDTSDGLCAVAATDATPDRRLPTPPCSPPVEDCSPDDKEPAPYAAPPAAPAGETDSSATAYDHTPPRPSDAAADDCPTFRPLLTRPAPLPITEVRIAPDNPGALVSHGAPAFSDS